MNSTISMCVIFTALFAFMPNRLAAQDQPGQPKGHVRYFVRNLGTLGGTASVGQGINNKGWVAGLADLSGDQNVRAALWRRGTKIQDLGSLGGPNSGVFWPIKDDRGLIAGASESPDADPYQEDYCGFARDGWPGNYLCLGFLWQNGTMTPLPTLGGNNGYATAVNNRGQTVGFAEKTTEDPNCVPPQIFDSGAFIWGPKRGEMRELSPFSDDVVAVAIAINDKGQVVGGSGICGETVVGPVAPVHAVLWQENESAVDLGNLGGTTNNVALGINNRGEVIGASDLAGDLTGHAFYWTKNVGMKDLGTLPGDFSSFALGINNRGQVVGASCDQAGNCRAFFWQEDMMTDLNTRIPPQSSLYLTSAADINDGGEITGHAYDRSTGESPAFLAIPCDEKYADNEDCQRSTALSATDERPVVILPQNVREMLRKHFQVAQRAPFEIRKSE
jgi:probable HAF family extracellular repeat protein